MLLGYTPAGRRVEILCPNNEVVMKRIWKYAVTDSNFHYSTVFQRLEPFKNSQEVAMSGACYVLTISKMVTAQA